MKEEDLVILPSHVDILQGITNRVDPDIAPKITEILSKSSERDYIQLFKIFQEYMRYGSNFKTVHFILRELFDNNDFDKIQVIFFLVVNMLEVYPLCFLRFKKLIALILHLDLQKTDERCTFNFISYFSSMYHTLVYMGIFDFNDNAGLETINKILLTKDTEDGEMRNIIHGYRASSRNSSKKLYSLIKPASNTDSEDNSKRLVFLPIIEPYMKFLGLGKSYIKEDLLYSLCSDRYAKECFNKLAFEEKTLCCFVLDCNINNFIQSVEITDNEICLSTYLKSFKIFEYLEEEHMLFWLKYSYLNFNFGILDQIQQKLRKLDFKCEMKKYFDLGYMGAQIQHYILKLCDANCTKHSVDANNTTVLSNIEVENLPNDLRNSNEGNDGNGGINNEFDIHSKDKMCDEDNTNNNDNMNNKKNVNDASSMSNKANIGNVKNKDNVDNVDNVNNVDNMNDVNNVNSRDVVDNIYNNDKNINIIETEKYVGILDYVQGNINKINIINKSKLFDFSEFEKELTFESYEYKRSDTIDPNCYNIVIYDKYAVHNDYNLNADLYINYKSNKTDISSELSKKSVDDVNSMSNKANNGNVKNKDNVDNVDNMNDVNNVNSRDVVGNIYNNNTNIVEKDECVGILDYVQGNINKINIINKSKSFDFSKFEVELAFESYEYKRSDTIDPNCYNIVIYDKDAVHNDYNLNADLYINYKSNKTDISSELYKKFVDSGEAKVVKFGFSRDEKKIIRYDSNEYFGRKLTIHKPGDISGKIENIKKINKVSDFLDNEPMYSGVKIPKLFYYHGSEHLYLFYEYLDEKRTISTYDNISDDEYRKFGELSAYILSAFYLFNVKSNDNIPSNHLPKTRRINKNIAKKEFEHKSKDIDNKSFREKVEFLVELYNRSFEKINYNYCKEDFLIHGDFSPENLINNNGTLYLIDFERFRIDRFEQELVKMLIYGRKFSYVYIQSFTRSFKEILRKNSVSKDTINELFTNSIILSLRYAIFNVFLKLDNFKDKEEPIRNCVKIINCIYDDYHKLTGKFPEDSFYLA